MPAYKLKDQCLFVDAFVYDETNKKPKKKTKPNEPPTTGTIELAHVMDKSTPANKYVMLNDEAAFIARFIVMGVDTDLISQIVTSEYPGDAVNAAQEVVEVYNMLTPYLEVRTYQRIHGAPKEEGGGPHSGRYDLDFRVNWFVTGGFKGPI